MTWTHDDPAQGSPAAIQGLAKLRSSRATKIRDAQQTMRAVASGSGAEWKAMSQTAFAAKLSKDAADIELLAAGLEAQAAALQTYAGQLSQLKDRQRVLEQQRSTAQMTASASHLRLITMPGTMDPMLARRPPANFEDVMRQHLAAQHADDQAQADLRSLEVQWNQLVADRRSADERCVSALQDERVLGALSGMSPVAISGSSPDALLSRLATLGPRDLRILTGRYPQVAITLQRASPEKVASWWAALPAGQRTDLVQSAHSLVGSLNGVPAVDRVAANRLNARDRLVTAEQELHRRSSWGSSPDVEQQRSQLTNEIAYLKSAIAEPPEVQLYLYDQPRDRIVEMIGTPSAETKRVVTYVPGTFADMNGIYTGSTSEIATYLVEAGRGETVAFVYKDGKFPQGILSEANDPAFAKRTGATLAAFQAGLLTQPDIRRADQVAVGHSWGTADVTAAEVAGAHWGRVASLSGAGMPEDWKPSSTTEYRDYSYAGDALQFAQNIPGGHVWDGRNPRHEGFDHGPYYSPPALYDPVERHNLVASNNPDNQQVLDDLSEFVEAEQ